MFSQVHSTISTLPEFRLKAEKVVLDLFIGRKLEEMVVHRLNLNFNFKIMELSNTLKALIPVLTSTRHKGQNGKIGIIGGSFQYTGAPYYAAISVVRGIPAL
jgi:hypothetical protein